MKIATRLILITGLALANPLAWSQSERGSQMAASGAMSIMASPVLSLEGKPLDASAALGLGGSFLVTGLVMASGEVATMSLKAAASGSEYLIRVSAKAVQGASLAAGQSVRLVAESTGYAVIASGQLLAFIPNAIGQALFYQAPVK